MPDVLCATCGIRPEVLPGTRLCRPCLEVAQTVLRQLLVADATRHVTAESLRSWAVGAVTEVRHLSPVAHVLRGVVQGLILAEDVLPDGPERGPLIAMELAAMQALQEIHG
jgi:hypothetical protein